MKATDGIRLRLRPGHAVGRLVAVSLSDRWQDGLDPAIGITFTRSIITEIYALNDRTMHSQTRLIGFTLVELLIVVVIVGIIAAFAVPAYRGHVISSRTSEATTFLAEMRVQVEQHFQDYRTYAGFGCSPPGAANHFTYACPTLSATAFTITATGKSSQGMAGFGYSINQANTRTTTALPNGWTGSGSACWVLSKDGSC